MGRWIRIDRRYNQPYRLTTYASHAIFKWIGLILAWVFVNAVLTAIHLGALVLVTTGGLIWYAIHCAQRNRRTQLAERLTDRSYRWPTSSRSVRRPVGTPLRSAGHQNQGGNLPLPGRMPHLDGRAGRQPFSNSMAGLGTNTFPNSRSTR